MNRSSSRTHSTAATAIGAVAALAIGVSAAPAGAAAPATLPDGDPIVIGALTSVSGPFTAWGVQVRDGMQLAVDELNAAGGVDGRPLVLEVVDDQSAADEGVIGFERLVEAGAVTVGGVISSGTGLNAARVAEEQEVPLMLVKSGSAAILTTESRYTFRTCLPAAPMVAAPIAQYIEAAGLTRVGAVIADYEWGHGYLDAFEAAVGAIDGVETRIEVTPVDEQDFITYLRSIEEIEPELIDATGHPPGSGPVTVQTLDLGIDVPVTGAWAVLGGVMAAAGDAAIDRYHDYACADYESDGYQELAARYLEFSDNDFMEDDAVAGYGIVLMVAEAVAEVGDDPTAIADYLRDSTFELPGYAHEVAWTEWGELASSAPIFSVIRADAAPEGLNNAGDWFPETVLHADPIEPYEP